MDEIRFIDSNRRLWRISVMKSDNGDLVVLSQYELHKGWDVIDETTPSGKRLFKCKTCGRISATPDKRCGIGRPIFLSSILDDLIELYVEVHHD